MIKTYCNDFNKVKQEIKDVDLVLADIPYNLGKNAYGSNPQWWVGSRVENGASDKAGSKFFETDEGFNIDDFLAFCDEVLKERGAAVIFCSHLQQYEIISKLKAHHFKHYTPLTFIKNNSAEVLKANIRIVGACEYGIVISRDKLPAFYNEGKMIRNWFEFKNPTKKKHPNQKPLVLLEKFIKLYTKEGDLVCDPVMGSGSTLIAAMRCNRKCIGIELEPKFYDIARERIGQELGYDPAYEGIF